MKRLSKPKPIRDLITAPHSQLNTLLEHTELLKNLQNIVQKKLDAGLQKHCQVSNAQGSSLTLATTSAAWATKIRYTIPDILKALHKTAKTSNIKAIRVIVVPKSREKDKNPIQKLTLNQNTAKIIEDMANTITDQELSDCLKRISTHTTHKYN